MALRHGKVRVALVGVGRWGVKILAALAGLPEVDVVALVDRDAERLRGVAQGLGGAQGLGATPLRCATALAEVLGAELALDAVVIAALPREHAALARQALEAGAHVFVEKPMALCGADAARLALLARRHGRVLMVGHLLHHHPAVERLYALADAGALGRLEAVVAARLAPETRGEVSAWWALGPHDLGIARRLLGAEPELRAAACLASGLDDVVACMEHPGGGEAWLQISGRHDTRLRRSVVVGTEQVALLDELGGSEALRVAPRALLDVTPYRASVAGGRSAAHLLGRALAVEPPREPLEWVERVFERAEAVGAPALDLRSGAALSRELAHFAGAVRRGGAVFADAEEGLAVVRMLERVERELERPRPRAVEAMAPSQASTS